MTKTKSRTTLALKQRTPPAGERSRAGQDVYNIDNWPGRFEMDEEYHRINGLDFLRMYVSASTQGKSNESTEFMQQLAELEHYYPNNRDAYEGRFWKLCRLTATHEDWLRG